MHTAHLLSSAAVLVAATMASAGDAGEPWIYAINHQGHAPNFGDTLIRFTASDTAGYETLGSLGVQDIGFGGLAFDGDGNLWAYAGFNSFGGAASGLYKVDLKSGAATVQGTLSSQNLSDLAWNPVDNTMYGVFSQGFQTGRLYTINLQTGAVTVVGPFTGLDQPNNLIGLAIDSSGTIYVFDNMNKKLYKSDGQLNLSLLYTPEELTCEGCELAVGSQGIGIDWSRDDTAYHGAVGQGPWPNYYANLNTFTLDGSAYTWGPDFGPNLPDGPPHPPQVQPGDVTVVPASAVPCAPADLNCDGAVDVQDLLILLANWGGCPKGESCAADLNDSGTVDVQDLLILLANWG